MDTKELIKRVEETERHIAGILYSLSADSGFRVGARVESIDITAIGKAPSYDYQCKIELSYGQ